MRLRPLNPAVTSHTDGPTGVDYPVDEHGAITVSDEHGRQLLDFPGHWAIDHTVVEDLTPVAEDPDADDGPDPDQEPPAPATSDKPSRVTGRKGTAKPTQP